jgi:hypothetical protein
MKTLSMIRFSLALGLLVSPLATGCGAPEGCDTFAEHLADVLAKEQGGTVPADVREKMVKKTTEACAAQPPSKDALDCAMKADSSKAMKACEGGEEAKSE